MKEKWETVEKIQPVALQLLKNSLKNNRLAHAYLFEGMRGTGKQSSSLLVAMSFFCENRTDNYKPCYNCINCRRIMNGNHPDLYFVEPDGLSIKKEQISNLQSEFSKTGLESNKKFYIIAHADKMTVNAANSLLKFLEEPHGETVAILLTENVNRIIPTILSRCQIVSFKPLSEEVLRNKLVSNGLSSHEAILLTQLTNNIDEAFQLSKDDWFAQAQNKVLKLYEVINKNSLEVIVFLQTDWLNHFVEKIQLEQGLDLLLLIYKDILNIQLERYDSVIFTKLKTQLEQDALRTTQMRLADQMAAILDAKKKLQANVNQQLLMEQLVLKLQGGSSFV